MGDLRFREVSDLPRARMTDLNLGLCVEDEVLRADIAFSEYGIL